MFYFSGMLQANSELHITSYKEFCEILLTVSIVNNMFKNKLLQIKKNMRNEARNEAGNIYFVFFQSHNIH